MAQETVTELLADRIKQARAARGWTAQQLADTCVRAGSPTLTRGTIAKIESGVRKTITAEEVAVLAFVLAINPAELLDTPKWPFEEYRAAHGTRTPGPRETPLHLMVLVVPDAIDPNLVIVTSWRQEEVEEWPPPSGSSCSLPLADLERHVAGLVTEAEVAWSGRTCPVVIEFVLPRRLLGLPVHRWRQEPEAEGSRLLIMDYEIALRSLERMRSRQWHRAWRIRWQSLQSDPSPGRCYYFMPDHIEARHRLDAILSDSHWNVLVLAGYSASATPTPGTDPFAAALRAGIPAVLWHPHASPEEMRDLVGELTGGDGMAELPARARALMLKGFEGDVGLAAITRDLVLLWDDPNRLAWLGDSGDGHLAGQRPSEDGRRPGTAEAG
ncbi:helix-turn-helix domain-containing protein [Amycolatopsis sp. NBC_00355]|uniref:VMAP-C domain-containing protein n=1 Tax=Amycolatopsis sp. NBC_00355 TaxID=2975957 RepID=UPI002E252BB1